MTESTAGDDRPVSKILKPPNRKKYEEDLEKLNVIVKEKDEELRALDVRPEEKVQAEINKLHSERELRFRRRQSVDSDLRKISDDIRKQESELTKVQSNLQYRTEHKINEAIQRLETQLKTRNFRLSEEKKVVAEIDALKRSTKDLNSYLALKKQIDEKRDQQRKLRDERDRLQKTVNEIRVKEESISQEYILKCDKAKIIRNDVEDLKQKVKDVQNTFNAQEKEYRQQKETLRRTRAVSHSIRKEEDRLALEEACKQESEELAAYSVPFAKETFLCNTLIRHLQKFMASEDETAEKAACDVLSASHGSKLDLLNESLKGEGMFLLRRKSDAEEMQTARLNTRVRKNKRRTPSLRKQIVHTPEIIDQFSQLQLTAPASAAEISDSIKQLKEKLSYYENSSTDDLCLRGPQDSLPAGMVQFTIFQGDSYKGSMASSANSYSESALSGSMPTTPDVQFDSCKSLLTSDCPRRQSQDSGTGDVDEHALVNCASESCGDVEFDLLLTPILPQEESNILGALLHGADSVSKESKVC